MRGEFKPIKTNVPGIWLSEVMPLLAQQMDKATLIRSVSYTPNGLFNHTAAMYQMLTGEQADKVSPSGQLEPPNASDYPNMGSHIAKFLPPDVPMLPFVMLPRPLQESNVIGKAGTAGFLGKAYDPYYLYPPGDDTDQTKMDQIKLDDFTLRAEVSKARLERRANLRKLIDDGMPELEKAVSSYALDSYYQKALSLILSGRARDAFDLTEGAAESAGPVRPAHLRAVRAAGAPPDRGRHPLRAGQLALRRQRRSESDRLGHPRRQLRPAEEPALPETGQRALRPAGRPASARHAGDDAGAWRSASSAARRAWASAPPATATPRTAATTGPTATPR